MVVVAVVMIMMMMMMMADIYSNSFHSLCWNFHKLMKLILTTAYKEESIFITIVLVTKRWHREMK